MDRNIPPIPTSQTSSRVALRKESVDRNVPFDVIRPAIDVSLSARRAWIEIFDYIIRLYRRIVALRKESVDRNTMRRDFKALGLRRSPQGERG